MRHCIRTSIRRAKRADLANINTLLSTYGLQTIDNSYINHRDICLVAEAEGEIVGLVWAGLMRSNKYAYVDYFTVRADLAHKGVGNALARECLAKMHKLGVERAFGMIKQDKWHDKSAFNALKMGMYSDEAPFTYVYGSVEHSAREAGV